MVMESRRSVRMRWPGGDKLTQRVLLSQAPGRIVEGFIN
jgi:hypothetical protein